MQVSVKTYAQAWYESLKVADKKQKEQISDRMLRRLQLEGRLSWLSNIVREIQILEDTDLGITDVTVSTAHESKEKDIEPIVKELLDTDNVRIKSKVDPELLGGMVVKTSDKLFDISMKRQLDNLNKSIKS